MGRDVSLSCAFIDTYHLQEWWGEEGDEVCLREMATATAGWDHPGAKQRLSQEVESTRAHIAGQRQQPVAGAGTGVFN